LKRTDLSEHGFTLLEVMIALSIISFTLVFLLHSQNMSITRTSYAIDLSRAALVSRKVLSEIDMANKIREGEWKGKEEMGDMIFSWSKVIEQSGIKGIGKVTVSITWDGADPFTIVTYRII